MCKQCVGIQALTKNSHSRASVHLLKHHYPGIYIHIYIYIYIYIYIHKSLVHIVNKYMFL